MIDQNNRSRPKPYLDKAISIVREYAEGNAWCGNKPYYPDILEIGSMRLELNHDINDISSWCCNDGHSTRVFAESGLQVLSVDIDTSKAAEACKAFSNVSFVNQDAIEFAKEFKKATVGLLFLDAWDVDGGNTAQKHLEFYRLIKDKLNDDILILIDDTDIWFDEEKNELFYDDTGLSGKGKLLIPVLLKSGYEIVFSGRQTMLKKKIL